MARALANLVLIIAVFLQCSPLRTCDWSTLLSGHSCHDAKLDSVATGPGARTAEVASHDAGPVTGDENTCVCNTPKGMENGGGVSIAPDFTPFVAGPLAVFTPPPYLGLASRDGTDAVPSGPNPPQHTPLLV